MHASPREVWWASRKAPWWACFVKWWLMMLFRGTTYLPFPKLLFQSPSHPHLAGSLSVKVNPCHTMKRLTWMLFSLLAGVALHRELPRCFLLKLPLNAWWRWRAWSKYWALVWSWQMHGSLLCTNERSVLSHWWTPADVCAWVYWLPASWNS